MRHASAAATGPGGFICCLLAHEQYALRAADVRIVARAEQMRLEATTPGGRVGTLTHAGRELPVYSLSALFGREPDRSGSNRHVIVTPGSGGALYGLLVDRMLRAPSEHPGRLLPIPGTVGGAAAQWFLGLLAFGDDLSCLVLSPAALDPRGAAEPGGAADAQASAHGWRPGPVRRAPVEIVTTFTSDALPKIGVDRFALGAHRVAAVAQTLPSIVIPGAAPWISELARWREVAVPILSFNGASHHVRHGARRSLVVRTGGRFNRGFVAFGVNDDIELHRATSAHVDRASSRPVDAQFVIGIYMVGDEPVALLDIDKLAAGEAPARARAVTPPSSRVSEPLPLVV